MVEVGLITPPVGMNVFDRPDVPLIESFKGVMPFLVSDLIRVVLLVAVPSISLFLVRLMY